MKRDQSITECQYDVGASGAGGGEGVVEGPAAVAAAEHSGADPAKPGTVARLVTWGLIVAMPVLALVWVASARAGGLSDRTLVYPGDPDWTSDGIRVIDTVGDGATPQWHCVVRVNGVPIADLVTDERQSRIALQRGTELRYTTVPPGRKTCRGKPSQVHVTLQRYPLGAAVLQHVESAPLVVLLYGVASFVLLRRPREPAARALFAVAAVLPFTVSAWPLGIGVVDLLTERWWPLLVGDVAYCVCWAALLHFFLVLPGPARSRPRRLAIGGAYLLPLVIYGGWLALALPGARSELQTLGLLIGVSRKVGLVMPFVILAVVVHQYRTVSEELRSALRLVLLTATVGGLLYLPLNQIPIVLTGRPWVDLDWTGVFFLPFPLALGAAVLRHSLFHINGIVGRSFVFAVVTLTAMSVFVASAVVAHTLRPGIPDSLAIAVGGVVVVAIQPLMSKLQHQANRAVFGARHDPQEVMRHLSERLGTAGGPEAVLPSIVDALGTTLRLRFAAIEVFLPDGGSELVTYGRQAPAQVTVPLAHQGEEVGRLLLTADDLREPFGQADRRLIEPLIGPLAVAVNGFILTRRMQLLLKRVVDAREEERRRLRQDIHDGTGLDLSTAALTLDLACSKLDTDPAAARALIADVAERQRGVVDTLHRIVHDLRPPELDELGLVESLRRKAAGFAASYGTGRLSIDVQGPAGPLVLPAAVEVAAYRIACEAMNNVVRHARARTAHIALWRSDDALLVKVTDDGQGLPAQYRAGVGMTSMRERVAEVGGTWTVTPGTEGGTVILARLPCDAPGTGTGSGGPTA